MGRQDVVIPVARKIDEEWLKVDAGLDGQKVRSKMSYDICPTSIIQNMVQDEFIKISFDVIDRNPQEPD